MPAIGKAIGFQGVGKNNLLLTLFVFAVVLALFFIPEIVGYQQTRSSHTIPPLAVVPEDDVRASVEMPLVDVGQVQSRRVEVAPVSEAPVREPLASGALEQIRRLIAQPTSGQITADPTADPALVAKCVASLSETPQKKAEKTLSESPLTWDRIRSPESRAIFAKAQGDALALSRAIPRKDVATRYALFNYVSALNSVQSNPEQFGEPTDAISYLENLDLAVTKAMFREGIDRSDYLRWAEISLGDELRVSRAARTKSNYNMPFNPRLMLSSVRVFQPGDHYLKFSEEGPAYVDFEGYVIGKDITRAEISRDGKLIGDLALSGPDANTGRRTWAYTLADARGVYLIKVYDERGATFERSYSFYQKARSFHWRPDDGVFLIPFQSVGDKIDSRFERYFRYEGGRAGSSNSGFSTF